jgi:hypothetical protein
MRAQCDPTIEQSPICFPLSSPVDKEKIASVMASFDFGSSGLIWATAESSVEPFLLELPGRRIAGLPAILVRLVTVVLRQ